MLGLINTTPCEYTPDNHANTHIWMRGRRVMNMYMCMFALGEAYSNDPLCYDLLNYIWISKCRV